MTARRKKTALILLAVTACILALCFWPSSEPSYQGKTLSQWMRGFTHGERNPTAEEQTALRAMGRPAIDRLTALLQTHDSVLKQKFIFIAKHNASLERLFIDSYLLVPGPDLHASAATALGEIGPPAQSAIPALLAATNEVPFIACRAKAALMKIRQEPITPLLPVVADPSSADWSETLAIVMLLGTNAESAVPILIGELQNTNLMVRRNVIWCLRDVASRPEAVVPALLASLRSGDGALLTSTVIGVLPRFAYAKPQMVPLLADGMHDTNFEVWTAANMTLKTVLKTDELQRIYLPLLIQSLTNPNPYIRQRATNYLEDYDPAAAARARTQ